MKLWRNLHCIAPLLLLSACGGGGSSAVLDCPASATCAVLDQDGGLLAADDASAIAGAELELPRGAIDQARTFSLRSVDVDVAGAVGPVVEIGPGGTQFDPAAILRLPYTAERVPDGYRAEQLRVAKLLAAGRLQVLPPAAAPLGDQRLQALTSSLSQFVVVLPDAPGIPQAPVADAGADRTVLLGETIALDGSASTDINGDALQYSWQLLSRPEGSAGLLEAADSARPRLLIDQAGVYRLSLVVSDGEFESAASIVTLATDNSPPVAVAGLDQTVRPGALLRLDGSGSHDPDGDQLSYRWTLTAADGEAVALSNPSAIRPQFEVGQAGPYTAHLVVNDGRAESLAAALRISTRNSAPVANAGRDRKAGLDERLQLDGRGSFDVDGDPLDFLWTLLQQPAGSESVIDAADTVRPTLRVDAEGDYILQLRVSDAASSSTDTVLISTANVPPLADAGADQLAQAGTPNHLDGSASLDDDGEPLTYRWSLGHRPAGSEARIADADATSATLQTDIPGDYVVQLLVEDAQGQSATDTVLISDGNVRPIARLAGLSPINAGVTTSLDGRASSDPNGDALSFFWALTVRPAGSLASIDQTSVAQSALHTDVPGDYLVQLIVSDGEWRSQAATRLLRVSPAVALSPTPDPLPSVVPSPSTTAEPTPGNGGTASPTPGPTATPEPSTTPQPQPTPVPTVSPTVVVTPTPTTPSSPTPTPPVVEPDLRDRRIVSGTPLTLPQPSCDSGGNCSWRILEQPAGSDARLRQLSDGQVELQATVPGEYLLEFASASVAKASKRLKVTVVATGTVALRALRATTGCGQSAAQSVQFRGCITGVGLPRLR